MTTYEAYSGIGRLVRTFGDAELAERYRERMAGIGCDISIRETRLPGYQPVRKRPALRVVA